jgi:RNA polymerase sigma-70 factor, ECF subfamily
MRSQNTLTSLWRELPRLRDVDRFDAWADCILVHACRLVLRRRHRRVVREIRSAISEDRQGGAGATTDGETASLEQAVVDRDLFRRAFDSLDADARALLVLRHLEERPVAEIARVFGIPDGTVKSRLFAARRALEAALDGEARP